MANYVESVKVGNSTYPIKTAQTYVEANNSTIIINGNDEFIRRNISTASSSWAATYVPTTGYEKQFLLSFVNTGTGNLTITHPTTGYNKVVNLYGSPTLVIPAGKTGEIAVTIGKAAIGSGSATTYMSFTCQLQDSATDPAFINAVVQQVGGRFVPLTGTIAGSPVTGNITTNKALIFDDRTGQDTNQCIIYNEGGVLLLDARDDGNMFLDVDGGTVTVNGGLNTEDVYASNQVLVGASIMPNTDADVYLGGQNKRFSVGYIQTLRSEQVFASGGVYESSDIRLKDVKGDLDLDKAYDLVDKCQTILYSLKADETDRVQLGLIAQEVKEVFPEIINEDKNGMLSVDYSRLTVIILKVLKDLIKRISDLERR